MLTAALSSPAVPRPLRTSATATDETYRSSTMSTDSNAARVASSSTDSSDEPPPHIRIVPHLESSRSLVFSVIEREVREGTVLKIGRFTDRFLSNNRITFRSKVVSRGHAEIWTEAGKFYIRDTRSSSGTFLNHVRLSPPNQESRPFQLNDGDVVQLGVDYQGGTEEIYRAVKMRIELNRNWHNQPSTFSLNTFQSLRNLTTPPNNVSVLDAAMGGEKVGEGGGENATTRTTTAANGDNINIEDCCICLYAIAPFQALFVAPCSHTFHFKCCRPLLQNYPGFQCPICRNYADLDASVAIEASEVLEMLSKRKNGTNGGDDNDEQQQQASTSASAKEGDKKSSDVPAVGAEASSSLS